MTSTAMLAMGNSSRRNTSVAVAGSVPCTTEKPGSAGIGSLATAGPLDPGQFQKSDQLALQNHSNGLVNPNHVGNVISTHIFTAIQQKKSGAAGAVSNPLLNKASLSVPVPLDRLLLLFSCCVLVPKTHHLLLCLPALPSTRSRFRTIFF